MKSTITSFLVLFLVSISVQAQFETSTTLYDTISEGPFITPEKGGYDFIFKTQSIGTMVSTKGQVINPSIKYDLFNHYHIQADGQVDSIFSIVVRSDVNHHYTMYQKGLPKLLQFRVGTSNDLSIDRIQSKYPEIASIHYNDEPLETADIVIKDNDYKLKRTSYNKGSVKEVSKKAKLDLSSDEGSWLQKGIMKAPNQGTPITILALGKKIGDDKERKFNDLQEYKFTTLNQSGEVKHEEEIFFDRAYSFHNSGIINDASGKNAGYFISFLEASGKANKDYNSAAQKVIFFDSDGEYSSETLVTLPFEPKAKEAGNHKIIKVLKHKDELSLYLYTPGHKKSNVAEGVYTFLDYGDAAEEQAFNKIGDINVEQDLTNKMEGELKPNLDYKYAEQLENGDLLLVACENGTEIKFLQIGTKGELKNASTSYLLNDINSKKAYLSFEQLDNQKLLIVSKVAYGKSVKTSYSIYDGRSGKLETIQPEEEIYTIYSYRNGDEIIVFGTSYEDESVLHFKSEKLIFKDEGVTTIGRD